MPAFIILGEFKVELLYDSISWFWRMSLHLAMYFLSPTCSPLRSELNAINTRVAAVLPKEIKHWLTVIADVLADLQTIVLCDFYISGDGTLTLLQNSEAVLLVLLGRILHGFVPTEHFPAAS